MRRPLSPRLGSIGHCPLESFYCGENHLFDPRADGTSGKAPMDGPNRSGPDPAGSASTGHVRIHPQDPKPTPKAPRQETPVSGEPQARTACSGLTPVLTLACPRVSPTCPADRAVVSFIPGLKAILRFLHSGSHTVRGGSLSPRASRLTFLGFSVHVGRQRASRTWAVTATFLLMLGASESRSACVAAGLGLGDELSLRRGAAGPQPARRGGEPGAHAAGGPAAASAARGQVPSLPDAALSGLRFNCLHV